MSEIDQMIETLKTIFDALDIGYNEIFRGIKILNCKIENVKISNNGCTIKFKCKKAEIEIRNDKNSNYLIMRIGKKDIKLQSFWVEYSDDKNVIIHY